MNKNNWKVGESLLKENFQKVMKKAESATKEICTKD